MRLVTLYSISPGQSSEPSCRTLDLDQPSSMRELHTLIGGGLVVVSGPTQQEGVVSECNEVPSEKIRVDHFTKCLMACVMIQRGSPQQQTEARIFLEKTLQGLKP